MLVHTIHWPLGWGLILMGLVSGAALGLGFHLEDFLGGYGSLRRRLVRLGHIALIALGILNLLFAISPGPAPGTVWASVASTAFCVGSIAMPLCCFLTAWRVGFRHLFFVPVTALVIAVATTCLQTMS